MLVNISKTDITVVRIICTDEYYEGTRTHRDIIAGFLLDKIRRVKNYVENCKRGEILYSASRWANLGENYENNFTFGIRKTKKRSKKSRISNT